MLAITGDMHGNVFRKFSYKRHPEYKEFGHNDWAIVAGDCGCPWPGRPNENKYNLDWLASKPWNFLFLLGNHDWYDLIKAMPVVECCGGTAHVCTFQGKTYSNIFFVSEPTIMNISGYDCLLIPGADSHDIYNGILDCEILPDEYMEYNQWTHCNPKWKNRVKMMRMNGVEYGYRTKGMDWWIDEKVNIEAIKALDWENKKFDFVISHEAPAHLHQHGSPYSYGTEAITPENFYLKEIAYCADYSKWYHGHHHFDTPWYWDYKHSITGIYENTYIWKNEEKECL